ncbi:peroxidase N1-like [Olea europaea subsp. europaea]|uniref:peroxidase n=1 Tax=Olea europaea subsp. europaea TaxID=158383 RepID=A0A8S0R7S8_OLEEU|nr:peroxidase N1-like [Olea europaea subsp. europaea]
MGSDYFKQMSIALFFLLAVPATVVLRQKTQVGFYSRSCPRVEAIVQSAVKSQFNSNPTVVPGLFRMHFHDCFVRGCDGSILINGDGTEKMAGPNHLLRGYEVIDDAKTQLEAACPSVISCADILALVACDAVVLAGGLGWVVPTGGRDGRVSLASDASNLLGFTDSIDVQKQKFAEKRSQYSRSCHPWGHNIGTSACPFFRYRLYNFNSTTGADPSIDSAFLPQLRSLCPENGDSSKRVGLDGRSENMFDNSFFTNMRNG